MITWLVKNGVWRFLTSREGLFVLCMIGLIGWTQWSRYDAARDAQASLAKEISSATERVVAKQRDAFEAAIDAANQRAEQDQLDMEKLRRIADELLAGEVDGCVIPDSVLRSLRAIR